MAVKKSTSAPAARVSKRPSTPTGSAEPRIDAYIEKAAPFAQPILQHLRALVHKALPDVSETIKWSMPFFTHPNGKAICNMAAFKAHASFGIWNSGAKAELQKAGFSSEDAMGSLGRITSLEDLPSDKLLSSLLIQAYEAASTGKGMMSGRSSSKPRPAIEPHPEFTAALAKNKKASAAFKSFPPSHQREYLEWIAEAKRDETRTKRIATAVDWIANGKQRNWKYQ